MVLIAQVDESLGKQGTPVSGRPLNAVIKIFKKYHESGPLVTLSPRKLVFPVVAHNLSDHVHSWYKVRYGDRLKVDPGICKLPLCIFDVVYECSIPVVYGQHLVLASKETFEDKQVLNAVDMIKDLSESVRANLSGAMENEILAIFQTGLIVNREMKKQRNELLISARHDSLTACEFLSGYNPNPSLSAWHSLQFAEKVIKSYISKSSKYPHTHDIAKLRDKAVELGYEPDQKIRWDLLNVSPSVRYEPDAVKLEHSVQVCHEAWRIAYNVLMQ